MNEITNAAPAAQVVNLRSDLARSEATGPADAPSAAPSETPGQTVLPVSRPENQGQDTASQAPADTPQNDQASQQEDQDPFERAAETLEAFLPQADQIPNTRLRIDLDDDTGQFIYQSIDRDSGEVVRQFPPEDLLNVLSAFRDVEGLAVDDEA